MELIEVRGKKPQIASGCFIAPNAAIIGDVIIGENSSIWFNCVLRGDVEPIIIGKNCNIQDGTTIHGTHRKCGVTVEDNVSVGHNVLLHGCYIGAGSLIGMGSIVMDMAKIGQDCLVGAGSLVTENLEFEAGQLILGRPAKAKRPLNPEEIKTINNRAQEYMNYKQWYV